MNNSLLRPTLNKITVAAVLPLIYLFFATFVVIGDASGGDFSQGFASTVVTLPASIIPELFAPRYRVGLFGYLLLELLNALALLVVCYIALHIRNAAEARLSKTASTGGSKNSHPLVIPAIVGLIPGYFAGSYAYDSTLGFMGPVGAIPTFFMTMAVVTALVVTPVYFLSRRW